MLITGIPALRRTKFFETKFFLPAASCLLGKSAVCSFRSASVLSPRPRDKALRFLVQSYKIDLFAHLAGGARFDPPDLEKLALQLLGDCVEAGALKNLT